MIETLRTYRRGRTVILRGIGGNPDHEGTIEGTALMMRKTRWSARMVLIVKVNMPWGSAFYPHDVLEVK